MGKPTRLPTWPSCPQVDGSFQLGSDVEVALASDPTDRRRLVAGWIRDRSTAGGGSSLGLAQSTDGGGTWRRAAASPLTDCASAPRQKRGDPWLSIGADGTAYFAGLRGTGAPAPLLPDRRVIVATQGAGNSSFSQGVVLDDRPGYVDKDSVTADPFLSRTAYATWTRFTDDGRFAGLFSRTVDGGATWSPPTTIVVRPASERVIGMTIAVPRAGTLTAAFFVPVGDPQIATARSADGGVTWSPPQTLARIRRGEPRDRETGHGLRVGGSNPSLATDSRGRVWVAWSEGVGRRSRIRIASSADGGGAWSRPRTVVGGKGQAFTPALATSRGSLGIVYYDQRRDRGRDRQLTTDVRLAASSDGGRSWSDRIVAGAFDMRRAPATRESGEASEPLGWFLGDYTSLVAYRNGFAAAYAAAPPIAKHGAADAFVALLRRK